MLKDLIDNLPNDDACLTLVDTFDKLLKKYARLLNYEDAYEELRLFFLELIFHIKEKGICTDNDGYIVSYISKSVKNQYIALSKKQKLGAVSTFSDLSEEQFIYVEQLIATKDRTDISEYFPHKVPLTAREILILRQIFEDEFSVDEVAQKLGVSRQAINQAKRRALTKIRNGFKDKKAD